MTITLAENTYRSETRSPEEVWPLVARESRVRLRTMELTPKLDADPYTLIGGEEGVRRLVDRFYDLMDELPEAAEVRALHARSLKVSREKLFQFFSGWLGGPQLYVERYGHPRLRRRHFPFAIGEREVEQWMLCMRRALEETVADEALKEFLVLRLEPLARHMKNQPA